MANRTSSALQEVKFDVFLDYVRQTTLSIEELYLEAKPVIDESRRDYATEIDVCEQDEYRRTMFIDGCFLAEFILRLIKRRWYLPLHTRDYPLVKRDLFLLENQLPFQVLHEVIRLRLAFSKSQDDRKNATPYLILCMVDTFLDNVLGDQTSSLSRMREKLEERLYGIPVHQVDALQIKLTTSNITRTTKSLPPYVGERGGYCLRSVTQLRASGIKFQPSKDRCFAELRFESGITFGTLTLPVMNINSSTKSLLLNLAAFEDQLMGNDYDVRSFLCIMDALIRDVADVSELRLSGILENALESDKMVAHLFHDVASHLVPNPDAYASVQESINDYFENKKCWVSFLWMAECWRTYLRTPWKVIGFLVGTIALTLTAIQTYFSAFPSRDIEIETSTTEFEAKASNRSDLMAGADPLVSEAKGGSDAARIQEVKAWLASQFDAAGKDVPEFEYTPRSIAHLHNLATISQSKTQAAGIVAADFRQKAAEYRSQAVRIREILENVGLAQESLPSNVVGSAQVVASTANLLNIRDTELSSFLVAMGDLSLRKTAVEEKSAKVQKESKVLLDYTRKAIARLTYLKRILAQLEDEVAPCEAQIENWKTNLALMVSKEREYNQRYSSYKALLNHAGYTPEISHGMLIEMAEHKKDLEKKTKPILDTLRSYQDLPPDKALAALAIEDKKRQYAGAEKYLEDVLQSALATSDDTF